MKSTNLLIENLVIGVWSMLWVLPVTNIFLRIDLLKPFNTLDFTNSLFTIAFTIAFVYFSGLLVNIIAKFIFSFWEKRISKKYGRDNILKKRRALLFKTENQALTQLLQRRSIIRIFRANTLNLLMFSYLITTYETSISYAIYAKSPFYFCLGFGILSFFGYTKSLIGYFSYLNLLMDDKNEDK